MRTPTLEELAATVERLTQRVHALEARVTGLSKSRARPRSEPEDSGVVSFTRQRCKVNTAASIDAGGLWEAYRDWCLKRRIVVLGAQDFAREVKKLGVQYERVAPGQHVWRGITTKAV